MTFSSLFSYFWQNEPHVFRFWSTLNEDQRKALERQLYGIRIDLLEKQKQLIREPIASMENVFEPFEEFEFSGNLERRLLGQQLIEQGRVGCLVLAGGQGTRLQHLGPKGTYPISLVQQKTLFQMCAEKVKAASQKAGRALNVAIMTSPDNDKETRSFFQKHQFFGLSSSQISFFVQGTLPLLDAEGHLFLQKPWQIATGSDGNGHSLLCFARSGILNQWRKQGVEYLNVILIDNPLADPFDGELLGFHHQQQVDVTLKCTEKLIPEEKVGVLVKQKGRYQVIEYSEMSCQEKADRRPDGRLKHCCANLSLFCFSLSFIQHIFDLDLSLPLHQAWKAAQYVDDKGFSHLSTQPIAWKFETFIFDWLMNTKKVAAILYPREECFAPLKNAQGNDSPESVRKALQQSDRRVIQSITGMPSPDFPFELAAEFYYPTPDLLSKWKGKQVTQSYVSWP